jgi:hypothetical protein
MGISLRGGKKSRRDEQDKGKGTPVVLIKILKRLWGLLVFYPFFLPGLFNRPRGGNPLNLSPLGIFNML